MPPARDPLTRAFERLAAHRFGWLAESLVEEPSFVLRPMFGSLGCYLHGRLMLILADRRRPWCGLLVPTEREAQPHLQREMPSLEIHPVLSKWLYLPEAADDFEQTGERLVALARDDDPRLGVEPKPKPRRRTRGPRARKGSRRAVR